MMIIQYKHTVEDLLRWRDTTACAAVAGAALLVLGVAKLMKMDLD